MSRFAYVWRGTFSYIVSYRIVKVPAVMLGTLECAEGIMGCTNEGLAGRGFRQSAEEWETRNTVLAESLSRLVGKHVTLKSGCEHGLDVGCQGGVLTDYLNANTPLIWEGVDPIIDEPKLSPGGTRLHSGSAHEIPFPDESFDCLILATYSNT